ncbi:MAG: hypothetical protein OXR03_04940, partial [Rhodospirillaceae bacterium]|nr:hypothetical protein [Rhodospirillaceae bacterium]
FGWGVGFYRPPIFLHQPNPATVKAAHMTRQPKNVLLEVWVLMGRSSMASIAAALAGIGHHHRKAVGWAARCD